MINISALLSLQKFLHFVMHPGCNIKSRVRALTAGNSHIARSFREDKFPAHVDELKLKASSNMKLVLIE